MKTFIKNSTILISILVIIASCNKEELNTEEIPLSSSVLDEMAYIENPTDVTQYISNPDDKDDEKISKYLLEIGIAAREVFKNNTYNKTILQTAKSNANSCIDLTEFIKNTKTKSSSKAFNNFISAVEEVDLTHLSTNPLKSGVIEEYVPAIYVPNAEIADYTKQPLISSGVEVNSELPGMENYEDYIVAWYTMTKKCCTRFL